MSLDAVEFAKQLLTIDPNRCDALQLLSHAPGLPSLTSSTPLSDVRRSYMRLAALVHPDKLRQRFDKATEAFQVLVKVFDRVATGGASKATTTMSGSGGTAKPKKVHPKAKQEVKKRKNNSKTKKRATRRGSDDDDVGSTSAESSDEKTSAAVLKPKKMMADVARSNVNCKKTPLSCPSCHNGWTPDSDKKYTLVMAYGAKTFCEVCLFQFSWASAEHCCPFCSRSVEYDVRQFDQKVSCTCCSRSYGYYRASVTAQELDEMNAKLDHEKKMNIDAQEREQRRLAREQKQEGKNGEVADSSSRQDQDQLIGQCVVDGKCPICRRKVMSKHSSHVAHCIANPPAPQQRRQVNKVVVCDESNSDNDKPKRKKRRQTK